METKISIRLTERTINDGYIHTRYRVSDGEHVMDVLTTLPTSRAYRDMVISPEWCDMALPYYGNLQFDVVARLLRAVQRMVEQYKVNGYYYNTHIYLY